MLRLPWSLAHGHAVRHAFDFEYNVTIVLPKFFSIKYILVILAIVSYFSNDSLALRLLSGTSTDNYERP